MNYKGKEIENIKSQNEELDIPLNFEKQNEYNHEYDSRKYKGNKKIINMKEEEFYMDIMII